MTCDRYRRQLALLVGNDLDPREAAEVQQHIASCPGCLAHQDALQTSTGVLQSVSSSSRNSTSGSSGSLWPAVQQRLTRQTQVSADPTPSWLTIGLFSSVCAALLWVTVSTPVFDMDVYSSRIVNVDEFRDIPRPAPRMPHVHLVDDVQPPVQIHTDHEGRPQPAQTLPSSFGDPRSF